MMNRFRRLNALRDPSNVAQAEAVLKVFTGVPLSKVFFSRATLVIKTGS